VKVIANWPVFGQSGWEVLCRGILLGLDRFGVQVKLIEKSNWNLEKLELDVEERSKLIRMIRTDMNMMDCDLILEQRVPEDNVLNSVDFFRSKAKKVCVSLFETDRCPNPWISRLNMMDEVWVFSEFNRLAWEKSGVKNVKVIPFGIDTDMFNPNVKPISIKGRKRFMFISSGDFTERKWFEGLIEAFVKEFNSDDDVCLLIKAHFGGFIRRFKDDVIRRFRRIVDVYNKVNPPQILFIGDKVPWKAMPRFYTAGDCFVLPSRGEGLGLPYAEALACGVPVIATGWGGQTEFLNNENAYFLEYSLKQIDDMEYIKKCLISLNHTWATPNVNSLRSLMRFVYSFPDLAKKKGERGVKDMKERTWDKVALWIINRVLEMQGKRGVKSEIL